MQLQLNSDELDLIYNCLEDCLNSDDWRFSTDLISNTMDNVDKIRRTKRGWAYGG